MIRLFLSVGGLLTSMSLLLVGNGLLQNFLALRMAADGFSPVAIGWIGTAYFTGFMAGSWVAGPFVARLGYRVGFALCVLATNGSILLLPAVPGADVDLRLVGAWPALRLVGAWAGLRLVGGLGVGGMFLVTESWLNQRSPPARRGRVMALYILIEQVASGTGQSLLQIVPITGLFGFWLTAGLVLAALIPLGTVSAPRPPVQRRAGLGLRLVSSVAPAALFGCLASGLVTGAFGTLGPLYAQGMGLDQAAIGWFMAMAVAGGMAFQIPVGRLADGWGRDRVLVASLILLGVLGMILGILPALPIAAMFGFAVLYGGFAQVLYPVSIAHANDHIPDAARVPATTGLLVTYGVGATIGPPLAAGLMDLAGPVGLFLFVGLVGLLSFLLAEAGSLARFSRA